MTDKEQAMLDEVRKWRRYRTLPIGAYPDHVQDLLVAIRALDAPEPVAPTVMEVWQWHKEGMVTTYHLAMQGGGVSDGWHRDPQTWRLLGTLTLDAPK